MKIQKVWTIDHKGQISFKLTDRFYNGNVDTAVTNFGKEKLHIYVEAIKRYGKQNLFVSQLPFGNYFEQQLETTHCLHDTKHNKAEFEERKHPPKVVDLSQRKVIEDAEKVADEFVTAIRLQHVLDKIFLNNEKYDISCTGDVVKSMIEDVIREAAGEVIMINK